MNKKASAHHDKGACFENLNIRNFKFFSNFDIRISNFQKTFFQEIIIAAIPFFKPSNWTKNPSPVLFQTP